MDNIESDWAVKLTRNQVFLAEKMHSDVDLFTHLIAAEVLRQRKSDEIQVKQVPYDRNSALITFMKTRPEKDYYQFLRALVETGQRHIAERIEGKDSLKERLKLNDATMNLARFPDKHKNGEPITGVSRRFILQCLYLFYTTLFRYFPSALLSCNSGGRIARIAMAIFSGTQIPETITYCLNTLSSSSQSWGLSKEIGLKFEENTKAAAIAFKKSLGLGSNNNIIVTGGFHFPNDVFLLEQESNNSMKCIPLPQLALTERDGHGSALINGCIVTFGGIDQTNHRLSSAECIDLNAMTTKSIASMITPRYQFSCGVIGDKVFACGGENNQSKDIDLCEYYDIINDKWIDFSSMKCKRTESSGDVLNGILYVTGGLDGMLKRSVEAYDPVVDKWTLCPALKKERYGHGCAILEGAIYVAGGWRGMRECERYDPRMSEWVECANMKQGRYWYVLVAVNDKLYAIGGYGAAATSSSVEMYDPRNNKWQIMENVIEPLWGMSAVVL